MITLLLSPSGFAWRQVWQAWLHVKVSECSAARSFLRQAMGPATSNAAAVQAYNALFFIATSVQTGFWAHRRSARQHSTQQRCRRATQSSSRPTAAVWSLSGAGHYAAANCALDGLAQRRWHAGLPAVALRLGPFRDTGMAAQHSGGAGRARAAKPVAPRSAPPRSAPAAPRCMCGSSVCL